MSKRERLIVKLCKKDKRVYMYIANDENGIQFMQQSENGGLIYCDGEKPTKRDCAKVMEVDQNLLRVDFPKHINGSEDYYYG